MIAKWKRTINVDEFREMYKYLISFMREYRLINWLIDITLADNDEDSLNPVREEYYPQLAQLGLRRMGLIKPRDSVSPEVFNRRREILISIYPFDFAFFDTIDEAMEWVEEADNEGKIKL